MMEDLGNGNVRVSGRPPSPFAKASVAIGIVIGTAVLCARASGLSSDQHWEDWTCLVFSDSCCHQWEIECVWDRKQRQHKALAHFEFNSISGTVKVGTYT